MEAIVPGLLANDVPLALGWPLAWYFVRQNTILQTKLMEVAVANISASIEMKNAVQALSDVIRAHTEN